MARISSEQFPEERVRPDSFVSFGRVTCGDLAAAESREWLVTNGIGGFASGTVAGLLTRRYHGLLVAALRPPLGRTLLVTKFEESAEYDGQTYRLSANRWTGGAVDPQGFRHIESFRLEGTAPVWTFAFADALFEKRVWMEHGANTTYVTFRLARGTRPLQLTLRALVNYRDSHSTTRAGGWRMNVESAERGLRVTAFDGAVPFFVLSDRGEAAPAQDWYNNFDLAQERFRGLDDRDDHLHAGTLRATLGPGESLAIVATTEANAGLDAAAAWERQRARENALLDRWNTAQPGIAEAAPAWIRQLVFAADQFVVRRPLSDDPGALSVIAGYHWFGDWGRDAMISLPGLALATGRAEVAAKILFTFARFVDRGMLPNVFPDTGGTPEYNTVDATLWYFEAVRQHFEAAGDSGAIESLFPILEGIVESHLAGTRYHIHADETDGLLFAGEPGVQLTWMDAKIGDWVVTPRIGKPVEVNALWFNALVTLARLARALKKSSEKYEKLAERVRASFSRFWSPEHGYCFDVIDGPAGNDASLRPNQIFAVSLPESPLDRDQQRAVVDACARHLLTSHGLRSLAPGEPGYTGRYAGSPFERDSAYHQGTVWGWLLGPFALAHLRVYGDAKAAAQFLEPMGLQLKAHGLGTLAEIFDGDFPFAPRGCIAQAWTVAEVLRAWTALTHPSADAVVSSPATSSVS
jgi:predicted glycogen debranching enzyme